MYEMKIKRPKLLAFLLFLKSYLSNSAIMFSSKPTAHKTNKNSQVLTTFQSSLQF